MTIELKSTEQEHPSQKVIYRSAASAPVYGLGVIGALIYYIGHATTLWLGVLGFFKAVLWPAMLVYGLLKYLHM